MKRAAGIAGENLGKFLRRRVLNKQTAALRLDRIDRTLRQGWCRQTLLSGFLHKTLKHTPLYLCPLAIAAPSVEQITVRGRMGLFHLAQRVGRAIKGR